MGDVDALGELEASAGTAPYASSADEVVLARGVVIVSWLETLIGTSVTLAPR